MTGFTESERYLAKLAKKSFLSIWSYNNLFRNQTDGSANSREGKEVCDLLVVFDDTIIIFSDKSCNFRTDIAVDVAWRRWYKSAILSSAKQIYGAERWIKENPTRIFTDSSCSIPLPITMPNALSRKVYRVAVVHSISKHCAAHFGGGSGSLIFNSHIRDDDHYNEKAMPFHVGIVDSQRGHIHVLDDTTLAILMKELDTIADFTNYLDRKENLLNSCDVTATGEEELLATYLSNINPEGRHDFGLSNKYNGAVFQEGIWEEYNNNPRKVLRDQANEISYIWDGLIEEFSSHAIANTQYFANNLGVRGTEPAIRLMAKLTRFERRSMGSSLIEFMEKYHGQMKISRSIMPQDGKDAAYIFLMLSNLPGKSYSDYRVVRRNLLEAHCFGLKVKYPHLKDIVGIALDANWKEGGSEDLMYLDAREWDHSKNVCDWRSLWRSRPGTGALLLSCDAWLGR